METPFIIINFKAYDTAVGKNALHLAKVCEAVANETGKNIAVAVQAADIYHVAHGVNIPVFAQHVDAVDFGAHTGAVLPHAAQEAGAIGTLINHSEKRIKDIKQTIEEAKKVKLLTCVCCQTAEEAAKIAEYRPDYVAYEPPELIGGDISVSSARPHVVKDCIDAVGKNADCLIGAGIKNATDIKNGLRLGAKGFLLASGITKAQNPEKALRTLCNALK